MKTLKLIVWTILFVGLVVGSLFLEWKPTYATYRIVKYIFATRPPQTVTYDLWLPENVLVLPSTAKIESSTNWIDLEVFKSIADKCKTIMVTTSFNENEVEIRYLGQIGNSTVCSTDKVKRVEGPYETRGFSMKDTKIEVLNEQDSLLSRLGQSVGLLVFFFGLASLIIWKITKWVYNLLLKNWNPWYFENGTLKLKPTPSTE